MSAELQPTYRRCIRINAKWGAAPLSEEDKEEEPMQGVEEEEAENFLERTIFDAELNDQILAHFTEHVGQK